jgi:hypothetical protein
MNPTIEHLLNKHEALGSIPSNWKGRCEEDRKGGRDGRRKKKRKENIHGNVGDFLVFVLFLFVFFPVFQPMALLLREIKRIKSVPTYYKLVKKGEYS